MTGFVFARDAVTPAERAAHYREVKSGGLQRVAPGVTVAASEWNTLDQDGRYRRMIEAALLRTTRQVAVSHGSAAALWRLPWLGRWPDKVHATARTGRATSTTSITMHQGPLPSITLIEGIPVVELARCVMDVAKSSSLELGVVVADAALSETRRSFVTQEQLESELALVPLRRGSSRARTSLALANGSSGSPGESLSRVGMERIGIPRPILQQRFPRRRGGFWFVDFWWPEYGLIGEFDGLGKYLRIAPGKGMTAADSVMAEKRREDELRALGPRVARWGWPEARSPQLLGQLLSRAGLPLPVSSRRAFVHLR